MIIAFRTLAHANNLVAIDRTPVAQHVLKEQGRMDKADKKHRGLNLPVARKTGRGPVRRESTNFQRPVSVGPSKSEPSPPPQVQTHQMPGHTVPVKAELESSSRAVRNSPKSIPHPIETALSYLRKPELDAGDRVFGGPISNKRLLGGPISNERLLRKPDFIVIVIVHEGRVLTSKHAVKFKDVHTSWFIYSTPTSIDSPPELPRNAMALEHNVLFMHINETQRTKYAGQLSNLIKYCVSLWIWNCDSLKWERISVGEWRVVNGYKPCLSLGYLTDIYPQRLNINDDLRFAWDKWDAEVEHRAEFMSVARVSTEEDRASISRLASKSGNLLDHVESFTKFFEHAFTTLDGDHDASFAKWILRNAGRLHKIILQSPRICERMSEDPLLKHACMLRIEAAYLEEDSQFTSFQDDIELSLLPKPRERQRILAAALDLDRSLRNIPIAQPFPTLTITCDALPESVSDLFPPSTTDLRQNNESSTEHNAVDFDEHVHSLNLSSDASSEDLVSKFLGEKDRKLRMVLEVIEKFRDDGETIASEIARAHEISRARLQHHHNRLDFLSNSAEDAIAQVDHNLNIVCEKPSGEADKLDLLDFGRVHTTEYLNGLWTIALRLLPSQGSRSTGNMKNQVLTELRRFDDSIALKFDRIPVHSSFMTGVDLVGLENLNQAGLYSEQFPEEGSTDVVTYGGGLYDVERSGSPPTVPQTLESEIHPFSHEAGSQTTSIRDDAAGDDETSYEHRELTTLALCAEWVVDRASVHHQSMPAMRERYQADHEEPSCASETRFRNHEPGNVSTSIQYETATEDALMNPSNKDHHSVVVRASTYHDSTPALGQSVASTEIGPESYAKITFFDVPGYHQYFSDDIIHLPIPRAFRIVTQNHLANAFVCVTKHWTVINVFLVLAGVILVLKVKMVVDHLILEVSHHYLTSEFRQMLRHDAERWSVVVKETSSINGLALSKDARYLAVAYGICVDIWDMDNTNTAPLVQYIPDDSMTISFLTWSPEGHSLAVCYEGGLLCVISMNVDGESSSLAVGFRLEYSQAQQSLKVFAAFIHEDILAVAMGQVVEIRCFHNDTNDPRWDLKTVLPASSAPSTGRYIPIGDIQSLHFMDQDCILVSYENEVARYGKSVWRFKEGFTACTHECTMCLPGVINDVCPGRGSILITAAGTYQVLSLGSTTAQNIFVPRDPVTKYPQIVSCAKYLSSDVIIGAGAGQLILWNAELGNRLQNLPFRDQDGGQITHHICTAYRGEDDSGWVVTAHDGGRIICWKTIDTR
ncbi:hypothetical protein C8R42DRAFT_644914 [Lentinula raphanica]|nr:hypothetical protein C8R42DRAFT_644914 [Lentinula raphanica]